MFDELPNDWEAQVERAYATMGIEPPQITELDGLNELGWREFLHPRTNIGRFARKPRASTTPNDILRVAEPHRATTRVPAGLPRVRTKHRQVAEAIRNPTKLNDAQLDEAIQSAFDVRQDSTGERLEPIRDAIDMLIDEKHRRNPIQLTEPTSTGPEPEEIQILQDAIDREFEPVEAEYLKWVMENLGKMSIYQLAQTRDLFQKEWGPEWKAKTDEKKEITNVLYRLIQEQALLENYLADSNAAQARARANYLPGAQIAARRKIHRKLPKKQYGGTPYENTYGGFARPGYSTSRKPGVALAATRETAES